MTRALTLLVVAAAVRIAAAEAPVHHVLEIRLDPAARTLRGIDRVTLRAGAPTSFTLANGFTIDRLVADDTPVTARAIGGAIVLALPTRPVHEVVVEYRGTLGTPPRGSEITQAVGGPDGSYLPPTGWYPTFDAPFTYAVSLDVPDPQRAVTPGRLTREATADGRYRATFVSDTPAAELPAFAGPYRIADRIHRGWRLRTYFHPAIADLSDTYLDHVQSYLDLYDGWIGAYPYAGFAVVSGPFPVGLGFPGITYLGTQVLRLPFIPDTSLGHEVLHSWWGACVRPGADGNWAEGLTTFMADYTYLERRGAAQAREERLAWLREFAVLPPAEDRPLSTFQGKSHAASQATGYHKAAFVFVMLRDEIGADAFASAMRRFWQAHRFESATWKDLESSFSEAARLPLARFFQQWVQRAGAPELALRAAYADGGHVSFELAQGEPTFDVAIPVTVETAEIPITRTVRLDEVAREYGFDVTGTPRALAVDPDLRVFRRLAAAEIPPIISGVAFDAEAMTVVAASNDAARNAAHEVADGMFEGQPRIIPAGEPLPARSAVLVVGLTPEVTALLEKLGGEAPARSLAAKGTARAWAARRPGGGPLVVVEGNDAAALRAVAGPLPHYGRESFVVFDGSRMIKHGLWKPAASTLRVELAR